MDIIVHIPDDELFCPSLYTIQHKTFHNFKSMAKIVHTAIAVDNKLKMWKRLHSFQNILELHKNKKTLIVETLYFKSRV